jgi:hypothetical protein
MGHAEQGENGNGFLNGNVPWWIRAIVQVGVPASMALFLVWYVTLGPERNEAHEAALASRTISVDLGRHMLHTEQLHRTMEEYMRINTLLMRHLCVSTAKQAGTDERTCFQP